MLADYTIEKLDSSSLVFPVDPSGQQTSNQPIGIADSIGNDGLTAGVYLQDEWRLSDQLTLNYGARYDRFDATFEDEGQLSPRANLVWQIDDKTSAHIGYARYFTPPSVQYIPPSTIAKFRGTSNAPQSVAGRPNAVRAFALFRCRLLPPAYPCVAGDGGRVL